MTVYADREGFVLIKPETTYGASSSPTPGTDNLYVEEVSIGAQRETLQRLGPSPYRHGFHPVTGVPNADFSVKMEVVPTSMTDEPTERPPEDVLYKMGGFLAAVSGAAADPDTVTYNLQSQYLGTTSGSESSCTIAAYEHNSDDDDGWLHTLTGCRGGWTLEITPAERWFITVAGKGDAYSHTAIGASRSSTGIPDYDFSAAPIVSGGASCTITAQTAAETYPVTGRVVSFTANTNNAADYARGICGQYTRADGPVPTASLVLEVQDAGDFDVWQYQGQTGANESVPDALLVQIGSPDLTFNSSGVPSVAGDYVLFRGYFFIDGIDMGDDSGAKIWTLNLIGAYPPSGLAGEAASEGIFQMIYGTKA